MLVLIVRFSFADNVVTLHVDTGQAINSFDPIPRWNVLSRTGIDKVYSPHIIQESLSAGDSQKSSRRRAFGLRRRVWESTS
jgi:hypothetical protein